MSETPAAVASSGATRIDAVRFQGAASLSAAELQKAVAPWLHRDLTYDDMAEMAGAVTGLYRSRGYMVASAYLPAQTISDKTVTIRVVEGKFSRVVVRSNTSHVSDAQILRTLAENLCGRQKDCQDVGPIRSADVERAGLLTSEIPGVRATYELKAGEEPGSTSLFLDARSTGRFHLTLGADNTGFAFTGRNRGTVGVSAANLLGRGDLLTLSTTYTGKGLFTFNGDASLPVGYRGIRVGIAGGHLRYALGGEFSVLNATGVSDNLGVYATYPLVRSLRSTLDARVDVLGRDISNEIATLGFRGSARAGEAIVSLSGTQLENVLLPGSLQYRLSYTRGELQIRDPASRAFDALTAKTDGPFGKFNVNLRREALFRPGWTYFVQLSGQYATTNLDSSEKFALGGAGAVRAYDAGAASADSAILATLESRIRLPRGLTGRYEVVVAPFYDYGWAWFNHRTWAGFAGPNYSELAGAGIYISLADPGRYSLRATYARRQPTTHDAIRSARDQFWLEAAALF